MHVPFRATQLVVVTDIDRPERKRCSRINNYKRQERVSRGNIKRCAISIDNKGKGSTQGKTPKAVGYPGVTSILGRGVAKDVLTVGVEAHRPETHSGHELLRLLKLSVAAKDGFDKLTAAVLSHGDGLLLTALLLSGLPHVVLADLEEFGEADPQTRAALEEVFYHFVALLLADLGDGLFGPLDLTGELDEEEPELTGHFGEGGGRAVVEDGPVVDPLAERVGVEDGA